MWSVRYFLVKHIRAFWNFGFVCIMCVCTCTVSETLVPSVEMIECGLTSPLLPLLAVTMYLLLGGWNHDKMHHKECNYTAVNNMSTTTLPQSMIFLLFIVIQPIQLTALIHSFCLLEYSLGTSESNGSKFQFLVFRHHQ